METNQIPKDMHEAEQYIRNPEHLPYLKIRYYGRIRRLFIKDRSGPIYVFKKGSRKYGREFNDFGSITKTFFPKTHGLTEEEKNILVAENNAKLVMKYKREAAKATFTNPFIRKCLSADPNLELYENGLSTGTRIDGQLISLQAIQKQAPSSIFDGFVTALKEKRHFLSSRFNFNGYDGSLGVDIHQEGSDYSQPGDVMGYFNKEYRGCGNGYYYLLINDNYFIGYDID